MIKQVWEIEMKKYLYVIKEWITETLRLMKNFKWIIGFYIFYLALFLVIYFDPPAVEDPIWRAEAVRSSWEYTNQAVYLGSVRDEIRFYFVLFFLATSNMRNHPRLARLFFLYPVFFMVSSLFIEMFIY